MRKHLMIVVWVVLLSLVLVQSIALAQISAWRKRHPALGMTVALNPGNPNTVYAEGSPGVIDVSFDKGKTWTLQMSPGVSSIRQILVNPKDTMTILCASASDVPGMVRTTDYGVTWDTVLPGYHIDGESMTYDPQHPDTMYAGQFGVGKVFRSVDRGATWTYQGTASDLLCAFDVRPDSANILYAGTGGGTISKSTNYGVTWRLVKPAVGATEAPKVSISRHNPMVAYATAFGGVDTALGVWKTTDGGETWFKTGAPSISMWAMDIDANNENIVYAGTFIGGAATVYKTTDGGVTWNALPSGLPIFGDVWSLKVHPLDPDAVWAAVTIGSFGFNAVYSYGTTSTGITGHVLDAATMDTIRNGYVAISSTGDSVNLAASDGAFQFGYFTADSTPTPDVHAAAFPYYTKTEQLAFVQDSILTQDILLEKLPRRPVSGVVTDSAAGLPRTARIIFSQFTSVGTLVSSESTDVSGHFQFDSVYITQPPVIQNNKVVVQPEIPFAYLSIQPVFVDTSGLSMDIRLTNADVVIISAADSGKYLSYYTSALESIAVSYNAWSSLEQGPAPVSRATELKRRAIIYYTGDKHTPLSQNELDSLVSCLNLGCNLFLTGQDIVEMNDSSDLLKNYLRLGFSANSTFSFVTGLTGGLFYRIDFSTITTAGANNQTSRDILTPLDPKVVPQLGYGSGIRGTAGVKIDSVGAGGKAIVFGFGFEAVATTTSRMSVMQKIMEYFDSSLVVGVNGEQTPVPSEFALEQNYPNPFNPTTRIQYSLPSRGFVSLKIYNMLGEEVAVLANGTQEAGRKAVEWRAEKLSSGVYFARLYVSSGSGIVLFRETKKLILLR